MLYTVNQLAKLAGISVRTLHHYDHMELLKPAEIRKNGYREYGEKELIRLQQILFFRELDFPLDEIKRVIEAPGFNVSVALADQRKLIEIKKKRLTGLISTIDKTLKNLIENTHMEDKELYDSFTTEEQDAYSAEAKQRWGNTDAYKQSMERTKHFTKGDWQRLKEDGVRFMKVVAAAMPDGPRSDKAQELIAQHYNALRTFYEPNLAMYRGLAEMYVNDPRFAAYYEKFAPGLAVFMRDAMLHYADAQEKSQTA